MPRPTTRSRSKSPGAADVSTTSSGYRDTSLQYSDQSLSEEGDSFITTHNSSFQTEDHTDGYGKGDLKGNTSPRQRHKRIYPNLDKEASPQASPESVKGRPSIHSPVSPKAASPDQQSRPKAKPQSPPIKDQHRQRSPQPGRQQQHHNKVQGGQQRDDDDQSMTILIAGCAFFILVVIAIAKNFLVPWLLGDGGKTPVGVLSGRDKIVTDFETGFRDIMSVFPSQEIRLWKGIKAGTNAVLKHHQPDRPSVTMVTIVNHQKTKETADCLLQKLSRVISMAYGKRTGDIITIDIPEKDHRSPGEVKMYIDDTLDAGFNSKSKVAVIRNLERLHSVAAMMFHSYCDNDSANFKDAHIIFTVHLEQDVTDGTTMDEAVENFLKSKWGKTLEIDQFSALWSRIGNNVVVVRPEMEDVLAAQCPH